MAVLLNRVLREGHYPWYARSVCTDSSGNIAAWGSGQRDVFLYNREIQHTLKGHEQQVASVAMSSSGHRLVSGSEDKTVKVWNTETAEVLHTLEGHTAGVTSVCVSSSGHRIASGSLDRSIRVWDGETGKLLHTLQGHTADVTSVCMSSSGHRIGSGGKADKSVKVWDGETGQLLHTLEGHMGSVLSVCMSFNGHRIVSGSEDKSIKVWDGETGKLLHTLKGHHDQVSSVCMSASGQRIISGSWDHSIKVWNGETGELLHTLQRHDQRVVSVCVNSDGDEVISSGEDGRILDFVLQSDGTDSEVTLEHHDSRAEWVCVSSSGHRIVSGSQSRGGMIWDGQTGELLHMLKIENSSAGCLSSSGHRILTLSYKEGIRLWDGETGQLLRTLEEHVVTSIGMSASGHRILSGSDKHSIKVWDGESGVLLHTLEGHQGKISSVYASSGDHRIVSGSEDKSIKVWDGETGALLCTLEGHSDEVTSVCMSSSGHRIFSGSWDMSINIWDGKTGELLRTLRGHEYKVFSVCASSSGHRFVSSSSGEQSIKVWDGETGELLRTLNVRPGQVDQVSMSSSGHRIVSGDDDGVHVWDIEAGQLPWTICAEEDAIECICLSSSNYPILAAGAGSKVKVWDVKTGKLLHTLDGHSDTVDSVCVTPCGHRIVSGSKDHSIKVWHGRTGDQLLTLKGHAEPVASVTITESGHHIASCSWHYVKVWDGETGKLLRTLVYIIGHTESAPFLLCMSSSGHRILAGCKGVEHKHLLLWNGETGELLRTIDKVPYLSSFSMSSSGHRFVSEGFYDRGVQVWDGETGELLHDLEEGDVCVWSVCMSSSGHRICSDSTHMAASFSSTIKVWDGETGELLGTFPQHGAVKSICMSSSGELIAWICEGKVHVGTLSRAGDGAIVFSLTPSTLVSLYKESERVDLVSSYVTAYPNCLLETVNVDGRRGNLLLRLVEEHVKQGWEPARLQWLHRLLETAPQLACAAELVEQPQDSCVGRRNLLTVALELKDVALIKAVLKAFSSYVGDNPTRFPGGLPCYDATHMQKALVDYPRETVAAMDGLWELGNGPSKVLRLEASRAGRLLRVGKAVHSWVWADLALTSKPQPQHGGMWGFRRKVLPVPSSGKDDTLVSTPVTLGSPTPTGYASGGEAMVPMAAHVVCIPHACRMGPESFLATCVQTTNRIGDAGLFERPALLAVLDYKWASYGRALFVVLAACSATLAGNFSAFTYYSQTLTGWRLWAWTAALAINLLPLVLQEAIQLHMTAWASSYLANPWNAADLVTYAGLGAALVLRLALPLENVAIDVLAAGVSLLLWLKLLYYFRGFQSTGVLVRAVAQITADIRFFGVILVVFIVGFGNAFFLLARMGGDSPEAAQDSFGTVYGSFLSLFSAMTGNYDLDVFHGLRWSVLPTALYLLYIVAQAVVMLNLLIALMGDSYDRVQERAVGEWRREQAKIVLELEQMLAWALPQRMLCGWQEPWLHVLEEAGKGGGEGDEWSGRVKAITRAVENETLKGSNSVLHSMKEAQAQLEGRLTNKTEAAVGKVMVQVSAAQAKSEAQVAALKEEVKELKGLILKLLDAKAPVVTVA